MILNSYIAVYVPSKGKDGNLLGGSKHKIWVDKISELMSYAFGGTSNTHVTEYWVNDKGDLIREYITIVKSFYEMEDRVAARLVKGYGLSMKLELEQEAVSIEQNGGLTIL